jgi:uncharacterized repeat protein (TIGR03837 family)
MCVYSRSHIVHVMILEPSPSNRFTVDLFCRVIDNFGDAGVCLRLARALVLRHTYTVRLWCDDVALLERFEPMPLAGLSFHDWVLQGAAQPAQGVICGFGCTLEDAYLSKLLAIKPQPAYLHLEYLSAETWVEGTHGLMSVHPRLLSRQRFCNPGFNARTGGLLHEAAAFDEATALTTLAQWGEPVPPQALRVLAFAYPTPSWAAFIAAAVRCEQAFHWVLPQGAAGEVFWQALHGLPNHSFTRLPYVSQSQFDTALRSCQAAWVRGEDSAVTALFTGLPMVWQLYPQDDGAEKVKTAAYVNAVATALPSADLAVWRSAMQAANGIAVDDAAQSFVRFLSSAKQATHHALWGRHCRENVPDLAATVALWLKEWKIN